MKEIKSPVDVKLILGQKFSKTIGVSDNVKKIKPGSTQERQYPTSREELETGKMVGNKGGSYDTIEQSCSKRAQGDEYRQDMKDNPDYYRNEP